MKAFELFNDNYNLKKFVKTEEFKRRCSNCVWFIESDLKIMGMCTNCASGAYLHEIYDFGKCEMWERDVE